MRKLLRALLWTIKALLLLIATAALTLWPISRWKWMGINGERYSTYPDRGEQWMASADSQYGWIVFRKQRSVQSDTDFSRWVDNFVMTHGQRWRWEPWLQPLPQWVEQPWTYRFGLFRVRSDTSPIWKGTETHQVLAIRHWSLALITGLWPGISVARALRRHRANRRARREGLCSSCGYDLRATPEKGAALLLICPECGTPSDAS